MDAETLISFNKWNKDTEAPSVDMYKKCEKGEVPEDHIRHVLFYEFWQHELVGCSNNNAVKYIKFLQDNHWELPFTISDLSLRDEYLRVLKRQAIRNFLDGMNDEELFTIIKMAERQMTLDQRIDMIIKRFSYTNLRLLLREAIKALPDKQSTEEKEKVI